MARNTLSWDRCSFCGRRGATFTCSVGGVVEDLCVYCIVSFIDVVRVSCRKRLPISFGRLKYGGVKGPDERLFRKFKIS